MAQRRRIAVTGIGAVTPLGIGWKATWERVVAGQNAVRPISRFDASPFPVRFAAEVADPGVGVGAGSLLPLFKNSQGDLKARLTRFAAREALAMSGLEGGPRVGVCLGSEAARPDVEDVAHRLADGSLPTSRELHAMSPYSPTELVAELIGAEGPTSTISTACTSSSQAIGEGMLRIRRGEVDAMVVGGVDVLVDPLMISGFSLLGALSTRNDDPAHASRPFDRERDGFVLGEGAGFLVLEELGGARGRGAEILAELTGFGCSCNAYRITDSPPDGRGAAQAMAAAIADARLDPGEIGYINAHGTSTQMNDVSEARGVVTAFGDAAEQVLVSSTKSMMGHLIAACGAVEAIITLMAVREGVLPPNINVDEQDPDCVVQLVGTEAREVPIEHGITNAFGFGGSNGSIIVSAHR